MAKPRNVNYQMTLLSVIAISFVILGHINFPQIDEAAPGTFYGWFPYYSFHLPLFLFISGYFFKDFPEGSGFFRSFGKHLVKKIKNLIIPYYIVNGLFLVLGTVLKTAGITYLQTFNLWDWLTQPWTRPYLVTYSVPTWYMISLFISEVYFILIRQGLKLIVKNEKAREIIVLVLTLGLGITAVYLSQTYPLSDAAVVYLRSIVMLFFIQLGYFYRRYLEKIDKIPDLPYFLIILLIQCFIILQSRNGDNSPGLYSLKGFADFGDDYFLAGFTGIALWLRVTRILASTKKSRSGFLIFVGNNTKYIMCFHVFGFFLLNCIFYVLHVNNIGMYFLGEFKVNYFKNYLYYCYNGNHRISLLYYFAGMAFSLLAAWIISIVSRRIKKPRP